MLGSNLWKTCGKPLVPCGKFVDFMGKSSGENKNQQHGQKVTLTTKNYVSKNAMVDYKIFILVCLYYLQRYTV